MTYCLLLMNAAIDYVDSFYCLHQTYGTLRQSLKATRNFSVSDWSKNFEVVFQDEEGWYTRVSSINF